MKHFYTFLCILSMLTFQAQNLNLDVGFGVNGIKKIAVNGEVDRLEFLDLDANSFDVQQRVKGLIASFQNKGFSLDKAEQAAYKILDLSVTKQATVLSYMDVFLFLGFLFLVCIPFVLLVKEKKGRDHIELGDVH